MLQQLQYDLVYPPRTNNVRGSKKCVRSLRLRNCPPTFKTGVPPLAEFRFRNAMEHLRKRIIKKANNVKQNLQKCVNWPQ